MKKLFGKMNSKIVIYISMILLALILVLFAVFHVTGIYVSMAGGARQAIGWIAIIVALIALVLLFICFRGMFASMQDIITGARRMSQGELNMSDIIVWENNDFKVLADAFNDMKSNLLFFIEQTKNNILVLSDSIDKVTQGMDATLQDNEHISDVVSEVARNSQQQLSLAENTVEQIEEVYRSVDNISKHISDVQEIASSTNSAAASGRDSLNNYNNSINIIADSMNNTYDFIGKLRENINDIVGVIGLIVRISDQLKMLALNASIEAARSGEAGKGFSIVAQEISVLSNQAKEGIDKINDILSKILENSGNVEDSISKSIRDFEDGKEIFANAIQIFYEISDKNQEVLSQISDVGSEVTNINKVTKNTTTMSQQVYESSHAVSDKTQEVANIVEQELEEFQQITNTVASLQTMLSKIENLVDKYNLDIKPIAQLPRNPIRIAVVCPFGHEFWVSIKEGVVFAKKELAKNNTVVDFYPIEDISEQKYKDAIEKCIQDKYDGIALTGYFEELALLVDRAVDSGIPVVTFNSEYEAKSKRLTFVGQNAYQSGVIAAEALLKKIGGKGRVLVVTSDLSIANHELRRAGFNDTIAKNKGVSIIDVLEVHDNNEEAYAKVKKYLTEDRNVDGIFLTAGGQNGTAQVVEELGLSGRTKIVLYDFMRDILEYIQKGVVTCAIGQDPFRQGHDPVIYLYNYIVGGQRPPSEQMWTRIEVVDKENVGNLIN